MLPTLMVSALILGWFAQRTAKHPLTTSTLALSLVAVILPQLPYSQRRSGGKRSAWQVSSP
nr:hypothetical protein [Lactococcus petauri]